MSKYLHLALAGDAVIAPTHNEVIKAINALCKHEANVTLGLCWAFSEAGYRFPYTEIPRILRNLGGKPYAEYFWPQFARDERLMMLAFMYEWTK